MDQAGVFKIKLYERKNLRKVFSTPEILSYLTNSGKTFEAPYCLDPKLSFQGAGGESDMLYNYSVQFKLRGLDSDIEYFSNVTEGWALYVELLNGNEMFFDIILKLDDISLDTNDTNTFIVKMSTKLATSEIPYHIE